MDHYFLRDRRLQLGLTQQQVADACGVSKVTVSKWESGKIGSMRQDKIAALAEVLCLSPLDIIGIPDEGTESYYENQETAEMAQQLFENEDLRVLFDAAKDVSPETLKQVHDILLVLKRNEQKDGN